METVRSADYIDYIGNAKALKQIYYYFEAVRRFHPDLFNCKIEAKYADLFDSFDPQHWGFDKILSRIRTQENLKMASGQIRRWFGRQD